MIAFIPITTELHFRFAAQFIAPYETRCVVLADMIRRRVRSLYIAVADGHCCAVIAAGLTILHCIPCASSGTMDNSLLQDLQDALEQFLLQKKIVCIHGEAAGNVLFIKALSALGKMPLHTNAYQLMMRTSTTLVPVDIPMTARVQRAAIEDYKMLFPLQEAYLKEEVIPVCRTYNATAARTEFVSLLKTRRIYMVTDNSGMPVAKGGIHAEGMNTVQIGGIYTIPTARRKQYATVLMMQLLADCMQHTKSPVLFVNKSNYAAQQLYAVCGFQAIGDYGILYY
ncbi:MAG: GNAT family N-acetyltransferase [Treponema sp.]|nr:GNAT family N-acetyltransferase [Treponema sp.]